MTRGITRVRFAVKRIPGTNWVLIDADQGDEATLCKVCKSIAASVSFKVASLSRSLLRCLLNVPLRSLPFNVANRIRPPFLRYLSVGAPLVRMLWFDDFAGVKLHVSGEHCYDSVFPQNLD